MKQIKKGDKGFEVAVIQELLNTFNNNRLIIDGDFGVRTEEAVKNFQIKYNLEIDGIVGVKTWTKIYSIMVHA